MKKSEFVALRGWGCTHGRYFCLDGKPIDAPHRTASVRDLDEQVSVPASCVRYARDAREYGLQPRIVVSGVELCRDMVSVFGGSDGIRTITLPPQVRNIRQGAFHRVRSLRKAVLNEGLETLGTDDRTKYKDWCGVFQRSALRTVRLPSTLRTIKCNAFAFCRNLKGVELPAGLQTIQRGAFRKSGLESVVFPASLRTVG